MRNKIEFLDNEISTINEMIHIGQVVPIGTSWEKDLKTVKEIKLILQKLDNHDEIVDKYSKELVGDYIDFFAEMNERLVKPKDFLDEIKEKLYNLILEIREEKP